MGGCRGMSGYWNKYCNTNWLDSLLAGFPAFSLTLAVLVLPNIKNVMTSHPFSKWDKVHKFHDIILNIDHINLSLDSEQANEFCVLGLNFKCLLAFIL